MQTASPPTLTLPRMRGREGWGFLPLMAALTATAWLTLWLWGESPYARYLDHGQWTEIGFAGSLCRALPGGDQALAAGLVVGGWVLMLAAMMLPTTLPLLDIFQRLTARRADRRRLVALVITGYLAVWGCFGLAAHLADRGISSVVRQSDWLIANGWLLGTVVLAIAGLYQFSALKYRCLDKCRSPMSFVIEHWRGADEKRQALLLGGRHGVFCVGCCWALMLIMFVLGTANIGWMLVLGAVMAAEKNLPGGRRLAAPLGAVLLLAAISVAMTGATG
jgi:predicted metal-binding membrane protein